MSIKILRKGLPIIGYAKLGEPGVGGGDRKAAPVKWDHIELTGVERDEHGRLCPDVDLMISLIKSGAKTCGGCKRSQQLAQMYDAPELEHGLPTELRIMLPYDDPEVNFPNRLAYHKGRTEFCAGDGVNAERRQITGHEKNDRSLPIYGEKKPHGPCGNECPDFLAKGGCKPKGRLRFILSHQESVGGVYVFGTTSWNSIANIQESIETIRHMTGGVLQWIPLVFDIVPQTVQPRSGGRAQTAWVARVYFQGNPLDLLRRVKENLQLRAPLMREIRQLEASIKSDDWSEQEIEEFRREFDPDGLDLEGSIEVPNPSAAEPVQPNAQEEPEDLEPEPDPDQEETAPEPDPTPAPPADFAISADDQLRIWRTCLARAKKLSDHAGKAVDPKVLFRSVLDGLGVDRSDQIPQSKLADALTAAANAKVPQ